MNYQNSQGRIYVIGLGRDFPHPQRSHLYDGTHSDPGKGLCRFAWNRDDGESWSIWRGNVGVKGICKHCIRRAEMGLDGVDPVKGGFVRDI